ncbi:MAG TPA: hypothetical protein DDY13_02490 [Cytophagales bacterium]|jgi:hypothetical protein|nr:hypothetical protein [Cytophagales bacterium]
MKIPVIKKLVEQHDLETLKQAEAAFEEGENPGIEVEGEDEGEQFTHVIAAVWIREKMNAEGLEFKKALREYTSKVRTSIT